MLTIAGSKLAPGASRTRFQFASCFLVAIISVAPFVTSECAADETVHLTPAQRDERLKVEAERFFQPLVDRGWATGIVVGVIDDRGSRVFGFGRKKEGSDERPDGDTVFEIGSVTKVFTGTLLADMVERGLLSVDDPVNKFLPDDIGTLKRGDREMRLVDLATHTSGLPRLPGNIAPKDWGDPYSDYTVENLLDYLKDQAKPSVLKSVGQSLSGLFSTKPKVNWEYSNLGVGLLGTLLERKAGQPYEELILERICRPLGMNSTRLVLDDSMSARLIPGHDADGNSAKKWKMACLAPCGGISSTANDMLKFVAANAGMTDSPLKPAFARAQQSYFKVNDNLEMGLNWLLRKQGVCFHNGMTSGYNSFVAFSKPERLGLVVLADTTVGGESAMLDRVAVPFIRSIIEDKPQNPPTIRLATAVDGAILQKYVGKYSLVPLVLAITVTCDEDRLSAQVTGQQALRIYAESEKEFFYKAVDARITFETDVDGNATKLVLHQNGKDMPAAREK